MLNAVLPRSLYPLYIQRGLYTSRAYSSLPRIISPSFWRSLIPKPLRHQDSKPVARRVPESRPWNPATFFIIISLVIGSNAINLLAVKKDHIAFVRKADAKIAALRNAIERVQKGEDVDVKKLLGTGDPLAEAEWVRVIEELQQERSRFDSKAGKWAEKKIARNAAGEEWRDKSRAKKTTDSKEQQGDSDQPKEEEEAAPGKTEFY